MPVLWILLEHQLKLNSVLRERALELRNSLKEKSMSLKLDLTMPTRPTPKDRSPSSAIKVSSAKPSNCLKMKPVPGLRLVSKLEFLSARLLLFLEKLRRARPFWMELIVLSANCKGTLQILALLSTICKQSMDAIWPPSASLSPPFTPCKLKLMVCFLPPKMQRRNPRRLWLMLLVLLMNFGQSRTMPLLWLLPRTLWETSSESLRQSLLLHSLALEKQPRLSRGVTAKLRSLLLPRERTERIKAACLT